MTPIVDCAPRPVMDPLDDPMMLTDDLTFRHDDQRVGINPQADGPVGKGSRHAVTVTIEMNQAGRGDPLGIFHEPIERPSNGHQSLDLLSPDIGDGAWFAAMPGLCPKLLATLLQPKVQAVEIPKWGAWIARAGVERPERSSQSVRFATY